MPLASGNGAGSPGRAKPGTPPGWFSLRLAAMGLGGASPSPVWKYCISPARSVAWSLIILLALAICSTSRLRLNQLHDGSEILGRRRSARRNGRSDDRVDLGLRERCGKVLVDQRRLLLLLDGVRLASTLAKALGCLHAPLALARQHLNRGGLVKRAARLLRVRQRRQHHRHRTSLLAVPRKARDAKIAFDSIDHERHDTACGGHDEPGAVMQYTS